ncbi:MAG: VWA domain-containing protein [Holophagaceae bacterium]|uniref:VWA domain-containing protein n=1 Tax=Candidatus Geothrix skivensis TaxID=2954439 RepID=A0A9D7SLL1_9BACT|nr:VWA domain-containing protein [Candidatus Geothrix skivensis]
MSLRRSTTALFACCAGLAVSFQGDAQARSRPMSTRQIPPAEGDVDRTLSPYFFVKGGDSALDQLPLKATSAKVAIAGVIADVKVTQVYRNTGTKAIEAIYVFPGSTRSAVYGMTMTIGERVLKAQIKERGQARADYEQAKAQGRSASLLEQHRPNVFQMNVANILPGDEIRVELCYTELLVPNEGTYAFVYPTVVGPRYAGRAGTDSSTGETWVANPYTHAGEKPATTFELEVKLSAGLPIQRMSCDTHRTAIAYDGRTEATLKLDPSETQGSNRDVIVRYQLAGGAVQSGLLLDQGKDENTFLLMAQPPKRVTPKDLPPREFVFIMDISGSQMGFPIEVSKVLMRSMIQGLRPQDLFNVMVFEGSSALWSPASQHATPENAAQALAFVRSQNGGGGTELGSAMRRALGLPRVPGISRTFVVSTDGFISADGQVFDIIRKNLGSANLFTFGIGSSVNRHLIEGMAHAGQGEAFVITKPEQAAAEAERFRAYVSSPVLTNLKLTTSGFQVQDLEPIQLPDVLAERPVICLGKWTGEAKGTVTLSGISGSGPWSQTFDVGKVQDRKHGALRQLWARQRIQMLSDYDQFGQDPDRKAEVTRLGLAYNLLTAYTSFIAVDTQVRNTGGSTTVTQPLPLPEGVSDAAVGYARQSFTGGVAGGAMPTSAPAPMVKMARNQAVMEAVSQDHQEREDKAKGAAGRRIRGFSGLTGTSDPAALRGEVEARLLDPALAAALASLPTGTKLLLKVDGSGQVVSVTFSQSFPGAAKAKALITAWRLRSWTGGLAGSLEFALA